ncbi:MAG: hypothetical protein V4640_02070 [Verrucomicrobiota bacterium]
MSTPDLQASHTTAAPSAMATASASLTRLSASNVRSLFIWHGTIWLSPSLGKDIRRRDVFAPQHLRLAMLTRQLVPLTMALLARGVPSIQTPQNPQLGAMFIFS